MKIFLTILSKRQCVLKELHNSRRTQCASHHSNSKAPRWEHHIFGLLFLGFSWILVWIVTPQNLQESARQTEKIKSSNSQLKKQIQINQKCYKLFSKSFKMKKKKKSSFFFLIIFHSKTITEAVFFPALSSHLVVEMMQISRRNGKNIRCRNVVQYCVKAAIKRSVRVPQRHTSANGGN